MKKIILITGSTDGIGKQTALELAGFGHKIVLHGRNDQKCRQVAFEIHNQFPEADIDFVSADLSSLIEIQKMAGSLLQKIDHLDVLINNAGVFSSNRMVGLDGLELNFSVNYLASYFVSHELLPLLKNSDDGRIINVSSIAHKRGRLNFDDLFYEDSYHAYKAYADSKLMLIYLTYELSEQLISESISVNALHPGVITTKLLIEGFNMTGDEVTLGAETPVYLATSDDVRHITGKYFDRMQKVASSPLSYDLVVREQLMAVTKQVINQIL